MLDLKQNNRHPLLQGFTKHPPLLRIDENSIQDEEVAASAELTTYIRKWRIFSAFIIGRQNSAQLNKSGMIAIRKELLARLLEKCAPDTYKSMSRELMLFGSTQTDPWDDQLYPENPMDSNQSHTDTHCQPPTTVSHDHHPPNPH